MLVAVVLGATGLVGRNLVELLSKNQKFAQIICLNRRHIEGELADKVQQHIIEDFNQLADFDLNLPADCEVAGFCCLGTTRKQAGSKEKFYEVDYSYVIQFANLMWRYQARHLSIVSSLGASSQAKSFYLYTKGKMEEDIKQIGLQSLSLLRPSLLLGERRETRVLEDLFKPVSKLLVGPLAKWQGIEASDVAKAMIILAEQAKPGCHIYPSQVIRELAKGEAVAVND